MVNPYLRGSEWRRWDLHVHSPASVFNNNFDGSSEADKWSRYFEALKRIGSVKVLGITDYFSIEGYKKVREKIHEFTNLELVIPNVELRILPVTRTETPINLHIIFSPDVIDELENKFFSNLEFSYDHETFKCLRSDLISLGKKFKGDATLSEPAAYRFGLEQFQTDMKSLKAIFDKNPALRENSFVVVSNSNNDGTSGIQHCNLAATREEIYRFADAIFSGNPKDRIYFLGQGKDSEKIVRKKYGGLKPCIHGSDAHDLRKLCKPDLDRFTWIKADPTFEGLKQILFEPAERVRIQSDIPAKKNTSRIIDSVTITKSNNWFDRQKIVLNEGMVSVIGEKGSGKTALADLIAYVGGDFECQGDKGSFIHRALKPSKQIQKTIEGASIKLQWADGSSDSINLKRGFEGYLADKKVRYLSQSFIEKKCSPDHAHELREEIEGIIFQYIPREKRMEQTTFKDLRTKLMENINLKKKAAKETIFRLNTEIFKIKEEINDLPEHIKERERLDKELAQAKKQVIVPKTKDETLIEKGLSILSQQKESAEDKIATLNHQLLCIEKVRTQVEELENIFQEKMENLNQSLEDVGIGKFKKGFRFVRPKNIESILQEKESDLQARMRNLEGDSSDEEPALAEEINSLISKKFIKKSILAFSLNKLDSLIGELEKRSSVAQERRDANRRIQETIKNKVKRIKLLQTQISNVEKNATKRLQDKITLRAKAYKRYIALLYEERNQYGKLYMPLDTILKKKSGERGGGIEFHAKIELDCQSYYEKFLDIVDFSKRGPYYQKKEDLFAAIKKVGDDIELCEIDNVFTLIDSFYKSFLRKDSDTYTVNQQLLRKSRTLEFENVIFDVTKLTVGYGIKYQGTNIELLSPGKKGVVLLIMYLALDTESTIPLLIDQPEENLDNKSVFYTLVDFFREAKARRQIIVITHNPNLVLNTDSEQVVVANFDGSHNSSVPRITYVSGAIEHSGIQDKIKGIREQGLEILEGGNKAFRKRSDKWGASLLSI